MKTIKTLAFIALILMSQHFYAQQAEKTEEGIEITGLGITVTEYEDLETIEWDEIFDLFDTYGKGSKFKVYLQLKDIKLKDVEDQSVYFQDLKFSVSGYKSEREELQQTMVQITEKLLRKYRG